MFIRVLMIEIHPEYKAVFETEFEALAKKMRDNAEGLNSVEILRAYPEDGAIYSMVTKWNSINDLRNYAGENWKQPSLPDPLHIFAKNFFIEHFEEWN